nr:MAG TPA: hypothetical protein [Caudoviricetes sp.]
MSVSLRINFRIRNFSEQLCQFFGNSAHGLVLTILKTCRMWRLSLQLSAQLQRQVKKRIVTCSFAIPFHCDASGAECSDDLITVKVITLFPVNMLTSNIDVVRHWQFHGDGARLQLSDALLCGFQFIQQRQHGGRVGCSDELSIKNVSFPGC